MHAHAVEMVRWRSPIGFSAGLQLSFAVLGGELPDSAQDLASFRGYRILHGTSLLGGRTRVTALAVEVLRPAPVS